MAKQTETNIEAQVCITVWGTARSWCLAPTRNLMENKDVEVEARILGNQSEGYFLVLSPKGFSSADHHCESLEEAFTQAEALLGIKKEDFRSVT